MKKRLTVHELRKAGFEVSLAHIRQYHRFNPQTGKKSKALLNPHEKPFLPQYEDYFLSAKGGVTVIKITKDGIVGAGSTKCSESDSYVRKVGVVKALGKALQNFNCKAVAAGQAEYSINCTTECKGTCDSTCTST